MGQALSIGAAIVDPISYGVGYASEALDPGGWLSAMGDVGLNMFGKAGNAEAAGNDVGEALVRGAGTDIRRTVNVFSGPAGWAAEGVSTTAEFAGHQNVGLIDGQTAGYVSMGASAGAGAWNLGSSLLSGAEGASSAATGAGAESAKDSGTGMSDFGRYVVPAMKVGSAGLQLYNGFLGAQTAAAAADAEAKRLEGEAEMSEIKAGIDDMRQAAETNAAAEEKERLAKRRRQLVGKGKVAAASNGVMLETRAESAPAMFEQDAAAEMAMEQGKVDYNLRIRNATHAANAALGRMSAANQRMGAANAKRLGNLRSTSSWIQGAAGAATSLASAFYD